MVQVKELKFRGIGPPFESQCDLIREILAPRDNILQRDVTAGRGYGKTLVAIVIAAMALSSSGNEVGLFMEPTYQRLTKVFLNFWKKIIPRELYELNQRKQLIEWINGAQLWYQLRNITGSDIAREDSTVGTNTTFVVSDEEGLGSNKIFYDSTLATIRGQSNHRFYLTISTARAGEYHRLVTSPGHKLSVHTSFENPYLPDDYISTLKQNMGDDQYRREILSEFVSLTGRIWREWSNNDWPYGNTHPWKYSKDRPYWLFCDIGSATGSFVIVQQVDALHAGMGDIYDGLPVWVACADLCPRDGADVSRSFQKIKREYGIPVCVVAGRDMNRRGSGSGKTASYFAQQVFGQSVRLKTVSEHAHDRQIQYDLLSALICNTGKQRRFCISKDFVSLDTESRRGVREMVLEDVWLPEEKRREKDTLPKNRSVRVSHVRDALLMGAAAIMSPPEWDYNNNPAL